MGDQADDSIGGKLDTLISLMAYQICESKPSLEEKATLLSSLGLSSGDIARICNTTPNAVRARLAESKRKPKKKKSK